MDLLRAMCPSQRGGNPPAQGNALGDRTRPVNPP